MKNAKGKMESHNDRARQNSTLSVPFSSIFHFEFSILHFALPSVIPSSLTTLRARRQPGSPQNPADFFSLRPSRHRPGPGPVSD